MQLQVKSLQDKLTLANDHIYELEHSNTQANLAIEKVSATTKKSSNLLLIELRGFFCLGLIKRMKLSRSRLLLCCKVGGDFGEVAQVGVAEGGSFALQAATKSHKRSCLLSAVIKKFDKSKEFEIYKLNVNPKSADLTLHQYPSIINAQVKVVTKNDRL